MTSPPPCPDCGTHHHLWQAHVFRTITTQSLQPPVITKDVSRSCVECERKQREIDSLLDRVRLLESNQTTVFKSARKLRTALESNSTFDKKKYQREYMRKRRQK